MEDTNSAQVFVRDISIDKSIIGTRAMEKKPVLFRWADDNCVGCTAAIVNNHSFDKGRIIGL